MRVLIFSLAYEPLIGGAEVAVREITDRLPEIEFDMVTMRFDASHLPVEKIGNVNVYRIDTSKTLFPFKAFLAGRALHKKRSYDATWSIMAAYAGFAALFFKIVYPSIPFILNLQEGDPLDHIEKRVGLLRPIFKKIFTKADKIQAISHFLATWAKSMGHTREVEVIPNGVEVSRFEKKEPQMLGGETITLITVSRQVKKNGVGDIIRALPLLPQNTRLRVLGTGPLEISLKEEVARLNLGERVEFLGNIPNNEIVSYLHTADIFIRPSLSEGQGISFIEAMAAGLPVIATPVGGIPDFLKDGETGVLCQPNDPESVAAAVKRLMNDSELRGRVKEKAFNMVRDKYDWDLIAKEMKTKVFAPMEAGR